MSCHITEEQRSVIIAMSKGGVRSLEASKKLSISHRTVKFWYARANDPQKETTNLKGLMLHSFLELARLLCWPAPKLARCLQSYIPQIRVIHVDINKSEPRKRAKPSKRNEGIVSDRTLQRYLVKCGIMGNVKKGWDVGEVAVHAVQIAWWEHDSALGGVTQVGDLSKKVTGWLLMMADRSINSKSTDARDLNVKFQLFPQEWVDSNQAVVIFSAVRNCFKKISTLHFVANNQGQPTAGLSKEKLKSVMTNIEFEIDKPTEVTEIIEIPASFPSPRSVENYLAIIMARKSGIPSSKDSVWQNIHDNIADEDFCASMFGKSWPFLDLKER